MNICNKRWLSVFTLLICGMLVATGIEAKKPVDGKPDNPNKTKAECIVFTGDLMGKAEVEGCCPNAGPWPAYTMTLDLEDEDGNAYYYKDDVEGQLFINFAPEGYKVQFWNRDTEIPGDGEIFFEINGGDIVYVRKTKYLTVTFGGENATLCEWDNSGECSETILPVTFTLIRTSNLDFCD